MADVQNFIGEIVNVLKVSTEEISINYQLQY